MSSSLPVHEKAFRLPYHDPSNHIIDTIISILQSHVASRIKAPNITPPYAHIVGHPGSGKTRAILELARRRDIHIVYCNLGFGSSFSGLSRKYPYPNLCVALWLVRDVTGRAIVAYLGACLEAVVAAQRMEITPAELVEEQMQWGPGRMRMFWCWVVARMVKVEEKMTRERWGRREMNEFLEKRARWVGGEEDEGIEVSVDFLGQRRPNSALYTEKDSMDKLADRPMLETKHPDLNVLFVFDDADSLATSSPPSPALLSLRAALQSLSSHRHISFLLTSSPCLPTLFFPAPHLLPSPPPLSFLGARLDNLLSPERLFRRGRAIWSARLGAGETPEQLFWLAHNVLAGGAEKRHDLEFGKEEMRVEEARVIWEIRMGIESAVMGGVYPSEPILAEAAARYATNPHLVLPLLRHLVSISANIKVSPYHVDSPTSLCARYLLLAARDAAAHDATAWRDIFNYANARDPARCSRAVPLKNLLYVMLGKSKVREWCMQNEDVKEVVEGGLVAFARFVRVKQEVGRETLMQMLAECAAGIVTGSCAIVVPTLVKRRGRKGTYRVEGENMACVVIRVGEGEGASCGWEPSDVTSIGIKMCFGGQERKYAACAGERNGPVQRLDHGPQSAKRNDKHRFNTDKLIKRNHATSSGHTTTSFIACGLDVATYPCLLAGNDPSEVERLLREMLATRPTRTQTKRRSVGIMESAWRCRIDEAARLGDSVRGTKESGYAR
ncbi:hypothetical protein BC937DRAFT_93654 [Endogone sp. FLAS-F59071]|nr:hypothetical protein BC937DRAFT_93654 [Endogone sp. FLAS-F59071]|eukprot:RUS14544.1 hypothetical protein BC937DRAFT_93654 [Endogone sp. FLAS-F59071]